MHSSVTVVLAVPVVMAAFGGSGHRDGVAADIQTSLERSSTWRWVVNESRYLRARVPVFRRSIDESAVEPQIISYSESLPFHDNCEGR